MYNVHTTQCNIVFKHFLTFASLNNLSKSNLIHIVLDISIFHFHFFFSFSFHLSSFSSLSPCLPISSFRQKDVVRTSRRSFPAFARIALSLSLPSSLPSPFPCAFFFVCSLPRSLVVSLRSDLALLQPTAGTEAGDRKEEKKRGSGSSRKNCQRHPLSPIKHSGQSGPL